MATKIANDNISTLIGGVDKKFIDNNDFIDIIQWNLRWFNSKDESRVDKIKQILALINSDIFVFQEVALGSLDKICDWLNKNGHGSYDVFYGNTGGQQRVAVMWDTEWVRTKDDSRELFEKNQITIPSGKDVFPRQPLWSYFYCRSTKANTRGFDFQLVGLHLKSQMDQAKTGEDDLQRTLAAATLTNWLEKEANHYDADSLLLGDFNEPPNAAAWKSFRQLEENKKAKFLSINDSTQFSHLMYRNRNDVGSLLDLKIATSPLAKQMNTKTGGVIKWLTLQQLLESNAQASDVKKMITQIREEITDHLPVLTRFGKGK
ncbi:MAG: endonuclease/exonuclease/phosphatase family protein [Chitinophagaceae bacterium]